MLESIHYIFIGILAFIAVIWTLSSLGVIRKRDDVLYSSKQRHLEMARNNIEQTYSYLESLPEHARSKVIEHLDNGMINHALETARAHHDVYHFFKNYS